MIPPLYDGSPKDTMCAFALYAATVYAASPPGYSSVIYCNIGCPWYTYRYSS